MADTKINDLVALTTPVLADVVAIVDDTTGTPVTKKISLDTIDDYLKATTKTLSNKTLTSPVITTPTVQNYDGWQDANETWAYASASTITIPAGGAAKYAKGDKIKLTQTTVKYFYVVGVADTVLTVTGGSDYTVANAAITLNYYSHVSSPIGFPKVFNFTPTFIFTTLGNGTLTGQFYIDNNEIHVSASFLLGSTSAVAAGLSFSTTGLPTQSSLYTSRIYSIGRGTGKDAGAPFAVGCDMQFVDSTRIRFVDSSGAAWSNVVPFTWAEGDTLMCRLSYNF